MTNTLRRILRGLLFAGLLAVVPLRHGRAQAPAGDTVKRAAIAGTVTDTSGNPVGNAEVVVDGTDLKTVTNDSGQFHLPGVRAGHNGFVVRKIGYTVVSFETTLEAGKTLVLQVHMHNAQSLDAVTVTADKMLPGLAKAGFYERERQGLGRYVRPETVDSLSYLGSPAQMLRNVPGIDVKCGSVSRCSVASRTLPYCLHLFVDGHYMRDELDNVLTTGTVGAFEIYRHPSEVPAEFQAPLPMKGGSGRNMTQQAGCGALVVWTKFKAMP